MASPAPLCMKAMSTPELGSRNSRRFSAAPAVVRSSTLMPNRASSVDVALAELRVRALLRAGGHYDRARRRRIENQVGKPQQHQRQQDERAGADGELAQGHQ